MSFATVELLEKHLVTKSYVAGYSLSCADKKQLSALNAWPDKKSFPNANRWANHIHALTGCTPGACGSVAAGACTKSSSAPAAKATAEDDVDDMFGDDDDEDELNDEGENKAEAAATAARKARMEAALKLKQEKDEKEGKKAAKEKPAEKSLVVLEVKPWEADTDLKMVWEKIKEYQQEGLTWGESYKLEPVAYGIMKLVMTCSIVDSLVLLDDVTENIESLDTWVQSVNIASMNKI